MNLSEAKRELPEAIDIPEVRVAVMGFGNPVRSDDAIGVFVIDELKKHALPTHVSLFDMGTSAFEVLFNLKGHQKIIIVDAVVRSGEPAGTVFKLPAAAIQAEIQDDPMVFLHSLKWDQALSYAKKILQREFPDDIQVYLIAVENIKLDVDLSDPVRRAGEKVAGLIWQELASVNA
jgi:hydrogenase maturation protease